MMVCKITCIVLFLFLTEGESIEGLRFIQSVFRHGDRAPENIPKAVYPNNPYTDKDYGLPYGALTNRGKERSFELGMFYRNRYGAWLGSPQAVKFFASKVPRTKVTAELVATGLFPLNPDDKWSESLQMQTIPIHVALGKESWFYSSSLGFTCGNSRNEQEKVANTNPELIAYLEKNTDLYEHITRHVGANGTYQLAYIVYHVLLPQYELGLAMPAWTEGIFPEGKLKDAAGMAFLIHGYTNELMKFGGGLWLRMWLENIDKFLDGNMTDTNAIFWSGHDNNVADFLVALEKFDDPHLPPYNSAVTLELHEIKGQYYVKVLYKRHHNALAWRVLGCPSVLCPLEVFRNQVANILPHGESDEICGKI